MKGKGLLAAAFFAVLLAAGYFYRNLDNETHSDGVLERKKIVDDWLSAGDELARNSGSKEGLEVMEYVRNSKFLMVPYGSESLIGMVAEVPVDRKDRLPMVPMLETDRDLGVQWKAVWNSSLPACFLWDKNMSNPMLVLKRDENMTRIWKGIMIIHEGIRARMNMSRTAEDLKDLIRRRAVEDEAAYSLEIRMLESIVGDGYRKLISGEADRIRNDRPDKDEAYQERIEKVFGPSGSEFEKDFRKIFIWTNSMFRIAEESLDDAREAKEKKIEILLALYRESNIK